MFFVSSPTLVLCGEENEHSHEMGHCTSLFVDAQIENPETETPLSGRSSPHARNHQMTDVSKLVDPDILLCSYHLYPWHQHVATNTLVEC
jgi:hypothetical protein